MTSPFFSIAIPTKGRSHLIGIALHSLLRQTFTDWEAIVADNNEDDRTLRVVERFKDSRIRYRRSGGLSMPDNWEFACSDIHGRYLCILEDKQALKYGSLERIAAIARSRRPGMIRWRSDAIRPFSYGHRIRRARGDGGIRFRPSEQVLRDFVRRSYGEMKRALPLPQFSAISRGILDAVRAGPVGRLCPPVSPDYTLALQALAVSEGVTYVDLGLVTYSDVRESNGRSLRVKGELARQFTEALGGCRVFFDKVPVKAITVPGTIYNDFCNLQAKIPALQKYEIDWPRYFVECYDAIEDSRRQGADMNEEAREWTRALSDQPDLVRSQVHERIEAKRPSSWIRRFRRQVRQSPTVQQARNFFTMFIRGAILRRPEWRFKTITEYLDWEFARNKGNGSGGSDPRSMEVPSSPRRSP